MPDPDNAPCSSHLYLYLSGDVPNLKVIKYFLIIEVFVEKSAKKCLKNPTTFTSRDLCHQVQQGNHVSFQQGIHFTTIWPVNISNTEPNMKESQHLQNVQSVL